MDHLKKKKKKNHTTTCAQKSRTPDLAPKLLIFWSKRRDGKPAFALVQAAQDVCPCGQ